MNNKLIVTFLLLVGIFLVGLSIYKGGVSGGLAHPTNIDRTPLREMNIFCSSNHTHPLFQGQEICAYIPNLKQKLGGK